MEHLLTVNEFESVDSDGVKLLRLGVPHANREAWCLRLCLLLYGLASEIKISDGKKQRLILKTETFSPKHRRGSATLFEEQLELTLSQTELEYWTVFLLKYFRDGVAEVDHIDSEFEWAGSQEISRLDLVLKFELS